MLDGSTVFWIGKETLDWLNPKQSVDGKSVKKLLREREKYWLGGAQTFMNEDLNYVRDKMG